jgi:hypothetical protein
MLYHKDYLIRILQQFVVFLAKLLKLKTEKDPQVILMEIEKAYSLFLGYPKEILFKMDLNSLLSLLSINNEFQYERIAILGILLLQEANVYNDLKFYQEEEQLRKKGLQLLKYCNGKILDKELQEIIQQNLNESSKKDL